MVMDRVLRALLPFSQKSTVIAVVMENSVRGFGNSFRASTPSELMNGSIYIL